MGSERAKLFMPFSPLKGYYDLIREKEKIVVPKKDLCQDSKEELSYKLSQVDVGVIIKVIHYNKDKYISTEGMVSKIDLNQRTLTIVKTQIQIDDIIEIYGEKIKDIDEE